MRLATLEKELELRSIEGGRACVLAVRAQPGARKNACLGVWNGMLKLAVTAPADKGRANESLRLALAELLDLRPNAITLVAGERSRAKQLRIDARVELVRARLSELLSEGPTR